MKDYFSNSHVQLWELYQKEGWMPKNWCFHTVVLEKTWYLRVPWTVWRWNQPILREIKPEYSLEGLILSFQYFGHLMWRANSMQKTLILGKTEGRRRRGWQRMRWFNSITDYRDMSLSKLWEVVKGRETWHGVIPAVANSQTQISDWKTTNSLS